LANLIFVDHPQWSISMLLRLPASVLHPLLRLTFLPDRASRWILSARRPLRSLKFYSQHLTTLA
jgi:hypothetical protein